MELEGPEKDDQKSLQKSDEEKSEEVNVTLEKIKEPLSEHVLPETEKLSQVLGTYSVDPYVVQETSKTNEDNDHNDVDDGKEKKCLQIDIEETDEVKPSTANRHESDKNEDKENSQENDLDNVQKADENSKSHLPSFPGTVTKSVPGSNDVKIEIDSNSLLDRVILYSLKNTVVDNSRLDAAKNKYMLNKGNITSNYSSNSNGSDSNSSSKSVEKLFEDIKSGCSKDSNDNHESETSTSLVKEKSDCSNESNNSADTYLNASNKNPLEVVKEKLSASENNLNVIMPTSSAEQLNSIERQPNDGQENSEFKQPETSQQIKSLTPKPELENDTLDFRDRSSSDAGHNENIQESSAATLDLVVISNRDEKSVPIYKRNHTLYVGLPDFSKQIFSAPSITRPSTSPLTYQAHSSESAGAPKIRNPNFSGMPHTAPDMQMREPDFSKSFANIEEASNTPSSIPVTPSNFPDIVRKNNYISDLQLKPPSTVSASLPISTSSYKIDFRSSVAISQKLMQDLKPEQPPTTQTVYPNMKKEGINAYNQQLIDEPMAHIIHKNQFLTHANDPLRVSGWNDKNERLLGGAASVTQVSDHHKHIPESEDLRKTQPAYYPVVESYSDRDFSNVSQGILQEFSLKQKEQQLRQEGTIITVKNESLITPSKEVNERNSADLFRDYKLKQPRESPDYARKSTEHHSMGYHQMYPDFPSKFSKYEAKVETIVKINPNLPVPPLAYNQEKQFKQVPTSSSSYHSPSSYHHQPKSSQSLPRDSTVMIPPQQWPQPMVQQQITKHLTSLSTSASACIPPQTNSSYSSHNSTQSQSPLINYGYPYSIPAPQDPAASKFNQNHQPFHVPDQYTHRNADLKEFSNRRYQPQSNSKSAQNYYHHNYPDFARHFDPVKKVMPYEQNTDYASSYSQADHRINLPPDQNYQRFPPHHLNSSSPELEIRSVRDREHQPQYQSEAGVLYYPKGRDREIDREYSPRFQEPLMRHQDLQPPPRMSDERSNIHQSLKVERRIEEPPKIIAGPSNLQLQRPQPTEVSVIANVKIEQAVPRRNIPSSSTVMKSTNSIFAEVKRESPLDLSVKTVKTKADSTGCDQETACHQRAEPSGMKIEFTPNFNKTAKTECRSQARLGPQNFPTRAPSSASKRPSTIRNCSNVIQNNRAPSTVIASSLQQQNSHDQVPQHASSSRNYFHEARFQPVKEINRPHAQVPALPSSDQYSERQRYLIENNKQQSAIHLQRSGAPIENLHYPRNDCARSEENLAVSSRRVNPSYPLPNQNAQSAPTDAYPIGSKVLAYHTSTTVEATRNNVPIHIPNHRDPLYQEREKDRKYVEDILYGRKKNEAMINHPDRSHYQPIISTPRKRVSEQQHISSSVPPKQAREEENSNTLQEPRVQVKLLINDTLHPRQYEQQRFQKVESHLIPMTLRQPPALVKREPFPKPTAQSYDSKYHPDIRKDGNVQQTPPMNQAQYPNSQYYPNPKAEMIHRSDPSSSYKQERLQYSNQNFQQRPDDSTLQLYPRIIHPIQPESGIRKEHQTAGPGPSSGESLRLINGTNPPYISGGSCSIARGADQSTILKLKTNLELKEQKKLVNNKSEHGDDLEHSKNLSPRQFRTKGELKGFIPLPIIDVKKDAETTALPTTTPSAFDLLDWGSACNDFVEQLETGKKLPKKKRSVNSELNPDSIKEVKSESVVSENVVKNILEIPGEVIKSAIEDTYVSSSDEDKPLLELVLVQSCGEVSSGIGKSFENTARNLREKQRLELEQKHAARLGPSSSESESEARRPVRTAVRVRRLRKRAALGIKKTDEEPSVEEETEEELNQKQCTTRSISKLDEITSSEDDKKKGQSKDKKLIEERKSTIAAKKALTTKQNSKKQESSSNNSTDSDDNTTNKTSKSLSTKNSKKLRELGDGPNVRKVLEEEKTMTRSKRKLEIEKKLSNSKILRNEKIVQNVSPDKRAKSEASPILTKRILPKRKDSTVKQEDSKRKVDESDSDANVCTVKKRTRRVSKIASSSSSEGSQAEEESKTERLRPRKAKLEVDQSQKLSKEASKKKSDDKSQASKALGDENGLKTTLPCRIPFTEMFPFKDEKVSKFTPGWEADTYNYKRLLKIPAGLITIGRPPQHGISHSLPDLDPQTSDTSEIFSEFVKSKDKDGSKDIDPKGKAESSKSDSHSSKKPSSIIDLLHQRVVQSRKKFKARKAPNLVGLTKQNNDDDLLPTPEKESEKVFGFKVNIFETSIITSRTRTENNALRKKEILKEVFGAEDERPKSAPPVGAPNVEDDEDHKEPIEAVTKISYDQKYREYLEKMNVDFITKSCDSPKVEACILANTCVKGEDDEDDDNETVVASERDLVTPTMKGKVKKGRGRRCKGSSGFDYIRKKKKPTSNASENPLSVNNIIKKRLAAMENLENKDETDISKEMKGWVLNKGVGESVLHKASRLDYVDVIAYCLERLNISPDQKDNAGYTPLHEACSRGHLEIARILLQYGANHSETALSGIRPLHEAIENGHVEIVRLLISFGADPCLATYSGQLPISMAEDKEMESFLDEYLVDIENKKGKATSWYFDGPFKNEDPSEQGFEVFNDIPLNKTDFGSSVASVFSTSMTSLVTATTQMSDNETIASETNSTPIKIPATPMKAPTQDLIKYQHKMKKCDTNSNNLVMPDANSQDNSKISSTGRKSKSCCVVVNQISTMKKIKKLPTITKQEQKTKTKLPEPLPKLEALNHKGDYDDMVDGDNLESDSEFLEVEESEAPLPPLYLLKDEGSDKWILLTDLCNLLKVKSKDAVLKQICPTSPPSLNKEMIRELKMCDFLEKAICLQLFCGGEKLNVRASKVSLVRYNDSVRNLLGVQTIRMNM